MLCSTVLGHSTTAGVRRCAAGRHSGYHRPLARGQREILATSRWYQRIVSTR